MCIVTVMILHEICFMSQFHENVAIICHTANAVEFYGPVTMFFSFIPVRKIGKQHRSWNLRFTRKSAPLFSLCTFLLKSEFSSFQSDSVTI